MAEHLSSPRRGWVTGVQFLLLVGGMVGAAWLSLWQSESVRFTAAVMAAWSLPQVWSAAKSWSRRGSREESPQRRDDVPPIVVLLVAAALLTWNALVGPDSAELWGRAVDLAAASVVLCGAFVIAFRPGRALGDTP